MKPLLFFLILVSLGLNTLGQGNLDRANIVYTAVPFLGVTPDSKAGGMGDVGVATLPDVNSQHWNLAKYGFLVNDSADYRKFEMSISYVPWLRALIGDTHLLYLSAYTSIGHGFALSGSIRYFTLGDIIFYDENATKTGKQNPFEMAADIGISKMITQRLSLGMSLRYIHSDLTSGQLVNGVESKAGNAFAGDLATYYFLPSKTESDNGIGLGLTIRNVGSKISYSEGIIKDFIPANLGLGAAYYKSAGENGRLGISFEANKLLVPTPDNQNINDIEGSVNPWIGISEDIPVIRGMFQSFIDAPGGFREELQEITLALGAELTLYQKYSFRTGYFYEHENKGNRKFVTAGWGIYIKGYSLDLAYLIPFVRNHPLENSFRFTLSATPMAFKRKKSNSNQEG